MDFSLPARNLGIISVTCRPASLLARPRALRVERRNSVGSMFPHDTCFEALLASSLRRIKSQYEADPSPTARIANGKRMTGSGVQPVASILES